MEFKSTDIFAIWELYRIFAEDYRLSEFKQFSEFIKSLDMGIEMKYEYPNGGASKAHETYYVVNPEKYMLAKIKYGF
jgi:hypothetical protein